MATDQEKVLRSLEGRLIALGVTDAHRIISRARDGTLILAHRGVSEIPDEVFELTDLQALGLGSEIDEIPDRIARLQNLRQLVSISGLSVSPQIGKLAKLERLSLAGGKIELPEEIGELRSLRRLIITRHNLPAIPSWVFQLHGLKRLELRHDKLKSVSGSWFRLLELEYLDLSGNLLRDVPGSLGSLSRLRVINLSGNRLADLPTELAELLCLEIAYLGFNNFETLPSVVTRWSSLRSLDLNSDPKIRVEGLDGGVRLIKQGSDLRTAPTSGLASLPRDLVGLSNLRELILHGNPRLQLPAELLGEAGEVPGIVWDKSVGEILEYYFRSLDEARPLNEAKLVLVGWGGVGKTSLVKRLIYDQFQERETRTEGIEVSSWQVNLIDDEIVRLNVWDFGGQEIMHATHQFFLTNRALYVLVLTGRSGSADTDADYWLRVIANFATGSPIIIVLNQIDLDPFELDEAGLHRRFPEIKAFVRTDCATPRGLDDLRAEIRRQTSNLPDLRASFPAAWFAIKDRLASMGEKYLTFEAYRRVCAELGETEAQAQERLAAFLHLLGIALNYRDDPRLRDTHVLNPHWVTEGIYAILNSQRVADQRGEVATTELAEILDPVDYPAERHVFLLDLMRKFELCFPFADQDDRYLIADLLPKQQPTAADDYADGLRFEYRYPVLPEGLLPRFIVRTHVLSMLRWRSGCVLSWEGNHALVRADTGDRCVRIWVSGPAEGRRRLLAVVRSDLDHIHQGYKFKVEAWVPVPGLPGLAIQYKELLAAERAGMGVLPKFVNDEMQNVHVSELLHGVDVPKVPAQRSPAGGGRPARIFISYSHQDERHKDALATHLKLLQREGLVDIWHDRRIAPGADWATEIDGALRNADIALFLVSSDFLASDYCQGIEVAEALRRRAVGELHVVPIVVRESNWGASPLAGLQAVPSDARAIASMRNRDKGWREVSQKIEALAREQLEKSRSGP
ncbi:COR domain-containing protein [Paractinoplanes toevensis]|uniref:non-specific serine/threonine protein kinase n=1 Tax=Paractinoplanes toevensis TaxID=571911 RepID=A0A919TBF0_9ACTN|nr:COR domain-containing protein [Actinoplanes toevensis]GIM92904.1 hypothetical protein Ato02nite_046970 [Actinoplanes toevensis]